MADNGGLPRQKGVLVKNILYYAAVLALAVLLVLMYRGWTGHKREYQQLVRDAAAQDQRVEVSPRQAEDLRMD